MRYAPQTLRIRISIRSNQFLLEGNQRGSGYESNQGIADLRQQIHDDLPRHHPEWVLPNGESPNVRCLRGAAHGFARTCAELILRRPPGMAAHRKLNPEE